MAAGDLVTADWQMEYQGLLLGDGTAYSLARVEGLLDLPDLRTGDRPRLRRHGLSAGDDFLGGRVIRLSLEVYGETQEAFQSAVNALLAATKPGDPEAPLYFRLPGVAGGGKRLVSARPRRRNVPLGLDFYYRIPMVDLEMVATDPRIYDGTLQTGVATLPTTSGGMTFPETPPITFGSVSSGGSILAENAGTFPVGPRFSITGPVTDPRLENLTTGKTLAFSLSLAAGETLEVDAETRTVLLGGTASRYSTLAPGSEWWDLAPGTSEVTFRAADNTAATLTMTWRSAWV